MNKKLSLDKIIFIIYLIILVWLVLFKLSINLKELDHVQSINLIPFYYGQGFNNEHFHLIEVIENIIIFIPLGIYLKMFKNKNQRIILYGFTISLLLEIFQYIFRIGRSDITDIITNTLGTIIGLFIYSMLNKIFKSSSKANKFINIMAIILLSIFITLLIILTISNLNK